MNDVTKNLLDALKAAMENPEAFKPKDNYDHNAWDKCSQEKVNQFHEIIDNAARALFGVDTDGDLGFRIKMIAKREFEPDHFFEIPTYREQKTLADKLRAIELLAANVKMASERLDRAMNIMRSEAHRDAQASEEKAQKVKKDVLEKLQKLIPEIVEEVKSKTKVPFDPATDEVLLQRDDEDLTSFRVFRGHKCIGVMWSEIVADKMQEALDVSALGAVQISRLVAAAPAAYCNSLNFDPNGGRGFNGGFKVTAKG